MKGDRLREEVGQTPGPWLREMHTQNVSEMLSDKQESENFLQATYESCITSKGCTSEYSRSVIPGTSLCDLACIAAVAHLEPVQSALGSEGGVCRASGAWTNLLCWEKRPARKLTPSWRTTWDHVFYIKDLFKSEHNQEDREKERGRVEQGAGIS